jgi:hypothetical protein
MTSEEISLRVVEILNQHHIPYMLVGSLSTNFHSVVRSTKDADIVVQSDLGEAARSIARECDSLRLDPQYGFESVTATRKLVLRAQGGEDFVVELFGISDDPHDQERFRRRVCVDWFGRPTWIASAEDALVTKLRWSQHTGREKDIADARNLIASKGDTLDWPYVESWCDRHSTRELLDKLRKQVRPQEK